MSWDQLYIECVYKVVIDEMRRMSAQAPATAPHRRYEVVAPPTGAGTPRARLASDAATLALDGEWRFRWSPSAAEEPDALDDGADWTGFPVPGHWQLNGFGLPAYTNFQYPFPVDPPRVPDANPTGDYRTTFERPADWTGGRTLLRFDGVDSWFELWLNGERVGDSSGSRLTIEFDLTPHLRAGSNLLAVRVHQWSFASYVEDQDQWWLSGIFRSVALLHRPAGGIDDVFLHADYDAATGTATLRAGVRSDGEAASVSVPEVSIPELGVTALAGETVVAPDAEPWSAESPRLYEVIVSTPAERVTLQVGFRRVEVVGVELHLNGRPITFRGVNRHDFDPRHGRVASHELLEADVVLMKQHNINAVRTSHYPPDPYLLQLCDRYGLYVIEECDIETHGFDLVGWRGNPSNDPAWAEVYLDRMRRMVERDKNHASVLVWSLGNEAGWGKNLEANGLWVKGFDPDRPVHYEADVETRVVDIYSRMYATFEELESIGTRSEPRLADPVLDARRRGMPMVQCEYAHAMGNGPGGLADYEAIFDRHPRLIGGFVWEWYDHGLAITDADGRPSFAYGGDFGERRHDGSFIVDGLLMPDRTPSPGLTELAAVFAPVSITVGEADIAVLNRQAFASTAGFAFRWTLSDDGQEIAAGVLDVPPVAAQEHAVVALPSLPDANGEAVLTVVAALAADSLWAGAGHPIAHAQRVSGAVAAPVRGAVDRVIVTESGYRVADAEFDAVGRLVRLGAREVVSARMDAWRPPTENDRYVSVTGEPTMESVWREDGLDRLEERLLAVSVEQGAVGGAELLVRSRVAGSATDTGFDVEYRWASVDGALRLRMSVVRTGEWRTPLPRLGLTLALRQSDPGSVPVSWYGYGPGESYPDSTSAVLLGEHCGTVRELQTDYVVPQENGRRAGVRRARIGELELAGLFDLTVRPWSIDHLAAARHASELSAGDLLWLHIDVGANGVGSAACGPGVREADRLILATAMLDICLRNVSM